MFSCENCTPFTDLKQHQLLFFSFLSVISPVANSLLDANSLNYRYIYGEIVIQLNTKKNVYYKNNIMSILILWIKSRLFIMLYIYFFIIAFPEIIAKITFVQIVIACQLCYFVIVVLCRIYVILSRPIALLYCCFFLMLFSALS